MKTLFILLILCFCLCDEDDTCKADVDCYEPYEHCEDGYCEHKGVFPIYTMEFIGIFVLSALIALASAGGIGGGEIVVPTIKLFFMFSQAASVPLA